MTTGAIDYLLGCRLPVEQWGNFNRVDAFRDPELMKFIAPFPPAQLMQNTTQACFRAAAGRAFDYDQ